MLTAAMNDTKWNELRLAMHSLDPSPAWSVLSTNGYQSLPDREWFYHFNSCGYGDIIHVDIFADSPDHRQFILSALQKINVPGEEIQQGFRVFGYLTNGQIVDYL